MSIKPIEKEILEYMRGSDGAVRVTELLNKESNFTRPELRSTLWTLIEKGIVNFQVDYKVFLVDK